MEKPLRFGRDVIGKSSESVIDSAPVGNVYTNRQIWGLGAFLIASFIFCYAQVFAALARQWWSNDMYSYGFLIPWISLYFVWVRRENLAEIEPLPDYIGGFVLLLSGLSALFVGQAGGILALQEISLMVTLPGIVLLLWGKPFLKVLSLPIAYLWFMIPIWEIITDRLHSPFQIFSANLGVAFLRTTGIPVYQEGIYIHLPNMILEVARACSGINYLIAVIAVAIPMAALFLKGWSKRLFLIFFAVIVSILANSLRVALIGFLSYYDLSGDIHGPYHILQGLFVSVIGYGAIFVGLWVLSKGHSVAPSFAGGLGIDHPVESLKKKRKIQHLGIFLSVLLLLAGSYLHFYQPSPVVLEIDLDNFPSEIGEWKGKKAAPDRLVYGGLGVDHELSRTYRNASDEVVRLYIGYFEYQEQGKELVSYKTKELDRNASRIKVALNTHHVVEINQVIREEGGQKRHILFWYDINGRIVADRYRAKLHTAWDALARGRSNGAVIVLTSNFRESADIPGILSHNEVLVREIVPLLRDYLPTA